jgi:perosamine synthetase
VIYVIHYLGWPAPLEEIAAICRQHGSMLVEDCALSMLSEYNGAPLGSFGDFSIFCLYKSLPVPNGGVLVQNRGRLPELAELKLEDCPRTAGAGRSLELALEAMRSRCDLAGRTLFGVKRLLGRWLRAARMRHVPVGDIGWDMANVNIAMSPIGQRLMGGLDYTAIRSRRRENFRRFRELLSGHVKMLRGDLPEGACPLFFPILVADKQAAARALWKRGISAVEFWNDCDLVSRPDCGRDALYLRSHVLELPLHQDVSPRQVEYIARHVRELELQPA